MIFRIDISINVITIKNLETKFLMASNTKCFAVKISIYSAYKCYSDILDSYVGLFLENYYNGMKFFLSYVFISKQTQLFHI